MDKQEDPKGLAAKLWAAAQGTLALLNSNAGSDETEIMETGNVSSVKHGPDIELKIDSVFSMPLDAYLGQEHESDSTESMTPEVESDSTESLTRDVESDSTESMTRDDGSQKIEESKCKMCMVVVENINDYLKGRKRVFYRQWKRRFNRCGKMCRIKHINKLAEKEYKMKKEKEDIMRLKKHIRHLHQPKKKDIKRLDDFRRKMLAKNLTRKVVLRQKRLRQRSSRTNDDSGVDASNSTSTGCDSQKEATNLSGASAQLKKESLADDKNTLNHQNTKVPVQYIKNEPSQIKVSRSNFDSKKVTEHRTPGLNDITRKTSNLFQRDLHEQQEKSASINDPTSLQNITSTKLGSNKLSTNDVIPASLDNRQFFSKFLKNVHGSELSSDQTTSGGISVNNSSLNLKSVFSTAAKPVQVPEMKPKTDTCVMMTVNGNNFLIPSSQLKSEFQPLGNSVQIEPSKIAVQQNSHSLNLDASRHLRDQALFGNKVFQQQTSSTMLGMQQPTQSNRFSTQHYGQPLTVFQTVTPHVQTNIDPLKKPAMGVVLPSGQVILNPFDQSANLVPSVSLKTPSLNVMPLKSTLPSASQAGVNVILSQPTSHILTTTGTLQGNVVNMAGLPQIMTPQLIDTQGLLHAVASPVQQQSQGIPMIMQQQPSPVHYIVKPDISEGHTQSITLPPPKTVMLNNQQYVLMPTIGNSSLPNTNNSLPLQQVTSKSVASSSVPVNESQNISQKNSTPQCFSLAKTEITQRNITATENNFDLKTKPSTTVSGIKPESKESLHAKLKTPSLWKALQTISNQKAVGAPLVLSKKKSSTVTSTTVKKEDTIIPERTVSPLSAVQHAPLHTDVGTAAPLHSDVKRSLGRILKRKSAPQHEDVICIDISDAPEQTVMPAKKHPRKSKPKPRRELDDQLDKNLHTEKSIEIESHSMAEIGNVKMNSSIFLPKTPTLPTGFRSWPDGATIEEKKITLPDNILQELRQKPVSEWATVGQIVPNKMF